MATATVEQVDGSRKDSAGRKIARVVLLVAGAILLVLSIASVWSKNFLLNTDRYVETVSPLASDPEIQQAAAAAIATQVTGAVDVEAILEDVLPGPASSLLAGPLAAAFGNAVDDVSLRALETEAFQDVWDEANRVAHKQVGKLLTGSGAVQTENGRVVLDLTPIIENVVTNLEDRGLTFVKSIPINQVAVNLNLFNAESLEKAQKGTDLLQKLAWVLPVLMLICFVLAVVLSRDRRRTIVAIGVTLMISMFVLALAIRFGRTQYLDSLDALDLSQAAASSVFDIVTRFLRMTVRFFFFLGLAFVLVGWAMGPSSGARWLRNLVSPTKAAGAMGEGGDVSRWVAAHRRGLEWVALLLVALLVVTRDHPKGWTVFWALVVMGIAVFVVELISARAPAEVDESTDGPTDGTSSDEEVPVSS